MSSNTTLDPFARLFRTQLPARVASALVAVGCTAALAGCGGTTAVVSASTPSTSSTTSSLPTSTPPSTTTSSTTSAPPSDSATAGSVKLAVSVTGSSVTPAPSTVQLPVGQTLVLTVTSDHADEIHAHGFEVEKEVAAGASVTMVLTGKDPGVYEVEMHHPALTILKVAVS